MERAWVRRGFEQRGGISGSRVGDAFGLLLRLSQRGSMVTNEAICKIEPGVEEVKHKESLLS